MAKPILLVGLSEHFLCSAGISMKDHLENKLHDYHVFVYRTRGQADPKFEVLNAEKLQAEEYQELLENVAQIVKGEGI